MSRLDVRGVFYRNARQNVIIDMSLCDSLGVTDEKCLIIYSDFYGSFFLKVVDIKYKIVEYDVDNGISRQYRTHDESDIRSQTVSLDSITSYAKLLEENQRLREILGNINEISKQ